METGFVKEKGRDKESEKQRKMKLLHHIAKRSLEKSSAIKQEHESVSSPDYNQTPRRTEPEAF